MLTITREMIDVLNNHLASTGTLWRIVPRDDYHDLDYDSAIHVEHANPIRSPFLVDQTQYTNCTSSAQTVTDTVSKALETTTMWYIKGGLKIGLTVKAGVNVFFANVETTITAEINVEAGYSSTTKTATTIQTQIPLTVTPMSRVTRQIIVEQQEAADVPFTVNIVLRRGVFDFAPASAAPLYRYYNPTNGDHFYKTDPGDPEGYTAEGVAGLAYATQMPGTIPLYRYYDPGNGDHFYKTDPGTPDGYTAEGIACYVYGSQVTGTIPLYRYYNASNGDHFYTTDAAAPEGYRSEGIACYLPSAEARMDIVSLLPAASQRAFQADGVFSGKTIDRRAEIFATEQPVTAETCAILAGGAARAPAPITAAPIAARITRATPGNRPRPRSPAPAPARGALHTTATPEAELPRVAVLDRTKPGVRVLRAR